MYTPCCHPDSVATFHSSPVSLSVRWSARMARSCGLLRRAQPSRLPISPAGIASVRSGRFPVGFQRNITKSIPSPSPVPSTSTSPHNHWPGRITSPDCLSIFGVTQYRPPARDSTHGASSSAGARFPPAPRYSPTSVSPRSASCRNLVK